jgi:HlyD family secretion protein
MPNSAADLGALSVSRTAPAASALRFPRRWGSRVVLPLALVAGFIGLVAWASWDAIAPPVPVKVVPVRVQSGAVEVVGQELFRANGWVEPRPLPVDVPVQTDGMYRVKAVRVTPGERVIAGQVLVELDDTRAALDLEAAGKRHDRRLAGLKAAEADANKAAVSGTNAKALVELTKAEFAADVTAAAADAARAATLVRAAELSLAVEEDLWRSRAVTSDVKVRQARQAVEVAKADRDAADAKLGKAKTAAEVKVRQAEIAVSTAAADVASLSARSEEARQEAADAEVEVRRAKLELDRTRVTAPVAGVVMALTAREGRVVGGKDGAEGRAVVTLYDPKKLQVRVEVPVAKFALIRPGLPVEVEVEDVLPGRKLAGVVLYDTHQANVSRNSVPVKVSLPDDPPPELRPDMIAAVRFRSPPQSGAAKTETAKRLVVPRRLLVADSEVVRVWMVDPVAGRAALRTVEVVPGDGDTAELTGGLNATDKLISTGRDGLKPGTRVKVVGEDR